MDILSKVVKKMGRFRGQCIFILDEGGAPFKDASNQLVAESLKTFMDPGPGGFPYCIVLTTKGEYDSHVAGNLPFVRRTKLIPIEMMEKEATQLLLQHAALQDAPELRYDDLIDQSDEDIDGSHNESKYKSKYKSVFATIYDLISEDEILKHKPQPLTSLNVLTEVIGKIRNRKKSKIDEHFFKVQKEVQELEMTYKLRKDKRTGIPANDALLETYNKKKIELKDLKKQSSENQEIFDSYFTWLRKHMDFEEEVSHKSIKIFHMDQNQSRLDALKDYILRRYYVSPSLLSKIETVETEFHTKFPDAKTRIDENLILEVINELKGNEVLKVSKSQVLT